MNKIEAGTKIIITTPDAGESYKKGDIFEVTRVAASGTGVYVAHEGREGYYVSGREFEVYTEPEYKVGDRVQITIPEGDTSAYGGMYFVTGTGTVKEVDGGRVIQVDADTKHPSCGDSAGWWVDKKYVTPLEVEPEPEPLAEWEKELLNVTPRTIAFEDIQEGDLIKAEYNYGGVKRTAEGVASKHYARNKGLWTTAEGSTVADSTWNAAYTLLERPEPTKPPKPNPFAEANVGSVARESDDYVWLKTADNKWQFFRKVKNYIGELSESVHTDTEMNQGRHHITHNA